MIKSIYSKLILWGSYKEYPSIVSILISILLPVIGLLFVVNQTRFKTDNDGKAHGLFVVSMIISLLWWIALILFLLTRWFLWDYLRKK